MAELNIGGEAFHVVMEGDEDAPVVMLSNAVGVDLHMWDQIVPELLKHYRVVRYDGRGHGQSVVSEGPYSIAGLGQDALGILDSLGLEKVDFIGLSLGGAVGQWLLSHAPRRIGKAVLADTAAQLGTPDMWNKRIQAVLKDGMPAAAPVLLDYWFTKPFREAHADQVAVIEDLILKTSPDGYAAGCAALRDMDLREAIRSIQAPVLVLTGRHDPVTPPGMGALIASSIPKAKLVTIEAAHLSNVEAPDEFAEKALEFLLAEEPAVEEAAPKPPKPPRKKPVKKAPPVEVVVTPEPVAASPVTSAPTKSATPKKAAAKKAAVKTPPVKKTATKKSAPKKVAAAKATPKKAPAKKGPVKKGPVKKAAPKKAAATKAATKKAMPKKAAAKKSTTKKTAVKKTSVKKASIKKSAAKKTTVKKTPPSRKTGPVKAARKPIKKAVAKKVSKRR